MSESTTESVKKKPFSVPAFSATIVASGATPEVPCPSICAAMMPAVCVPCPARSWIADFFEQSPRVTCSDGSDVGVVE